MRPWSEMDAAGRVLADIEAHPFKAPGRSKVTPEERAARWLVKARSGGWCEIQITDTCHTQATDFSHRIREGQGGQWSASNGLHACRPCHSWVSLYPFGARAKGWALWSYEDSALEPVYHRGQWVLLGDDGSVTPCGPPALRVVQWWSGEVQGE